MPWLFTIPEFVKKRACRYLLQHYLGQYLEEKIQLEDLTIDLYNGTGTITNVPLNVEAINDALEGTGAPVQVVSGYLGRVTISVPWSALMSESCRVEVSGLTLSVMPCISSLDGEDLATMTDSLFIRDLSSSLQIAEQVMKSGPVEGEEEDKGGGGEGRPAFEGMEALARAIETVLSRVQIDLKDTVVQLVCRSSNYTHQYFLRLRVQSIKFFDELSGGGEESSVDGPSQTEGGEANVPAAVETKILELSDISVEVGGVGEDIHTSTLSSDNTPGVPVACVSGGVCVSVKVRGADSIPVPRVQVEAVVGGIHCLLAPSQLHILTEVITATLKSGGSVSQSGFEQAGAGVNRPIPTGELRGIESQLKHHLKEERRQRERRGDLLTADPYHRPLHSTTRGAPFFGGMTDSISADMFYSLNLHDSFSEASRSEASGERSMESSICTTAGSVTTMGDSYMSSVSRSHRGRSPESVRSGVFSEDGELESIALGEGSGLQQLAQSPGSVRRSGSRHSRARGGRAGLAPHDVCKYSLSLSGITLAILQANPAYTHPTTDTSHRKSPPDPAQQYSSLDSSGLDPMCYLLEVGGVLRGGVNRKEIQRQQERLAQALPLDHLLVWFSTVKAGVSLQGTSTDLQLTVASCELWEFLYSNSANLPHITTPVSAAPLIELSEDPSLTQPCIRLKVSSSNDYSSRKRHKQSSPGQLVSIDLTLTSPHVNLDPTLLERLQPIILSLSSPTTSHSGRGGHAGLAVSQAQLKHSLYMTTSNFHSVSLQRQAVFNQAVNSDHHSSPELRVHLKLTTSSLSLSLRFPVPELNEAHRRLPWYHPSLRREVLHVTLSHLTLTSTLLPHLLPHTSSVYDAYFTHANVFLSCDGSVEGRELFLTVSSTGKPSPYGTTETTRARAQLVVQCASESILSQLDKRSRPSTNTPSHLHMLEDLGLTLEGDNAGDELQEPSPFSTKKDMYSGKGGTHSSDEGPLPQEHTEQLVTPGDRSEMEEFENYSSSLSQHHISLHLPRVCVHLPSKSFLETLYCRFVTDLALWRPASPEQVERANTAKSLFFSSVDIQPAATAEEKVQMCKSVLKECSEDEEDEEDFAQDFLPSPPPAASCHTPGLSLLALSVSVDTACFSMALPITHHNNKSDSRQRESPSNRSASDSPGDSLYTSALSDPPLLPELDSVPDRVGEGEREGHRATVRGAAGETERDGDEGDCGLAVIELSSLHFYLVSGYHGDPNHDYVCAHVDHFSLAHTGSLQSSGLAPFSAVLNSTPHTTLSRLNRIIERSPERLQLKPTPRGATHSPMILVAMDIRLEPERNSKTNKCAVALYGTLLNHYVTPPALNCFSQLAEFFNLSEESVEGYESPSLITEMHLQLQNLRLEYCPLHLPLKALLGITSVQLSTSLVAGSPLLVVRILVDHTHLALSDSHKHSPSLRDDYVCVLDLDWFELTLRLCNTVQFEEESQKLFSHLPELSLECSSNILQIHTCVDSCVALRDLLVYLASDGDLRAHQAEDSRSSDLATGDDNSVRVAPHSSTSLPSSTSLDVDDLMTDAMEDSSVATPTPPSSVKPVSSGLIPPTASTGHDRVSSKSKMQVTECGEKSLDIDFGDSDDEQGEEELVRDAGGSHAVNGGSPGGNGLVAELTDAMEDEEEDGTGGELQRRQSVGSGTRGRHRVVEDLDDNGFCLLSAPTTTYVAPGSKPVIKCLLSEGETWKIVDNHFAMPEHHVDQLQRPKHFPEPVFQYTLKELTIIWHLYGGHDFTSTQPTSGASSTSHSPPQHTTSTASPFSAQHQHRHHNPSSSSSRATPLSSGGEGTPVSVQPGRGPAGKSKGAGRGRGGWSFSGGPGRDHSVHMELEVDKMRLQYEVFPQDTTQASRLAFLIRDLEIRDRLAQSNINKFLYQYTTESMPRQSHANMVSLKVLTTRPELEEARLDEEEVSIRLAILPIRLNIDQDTFYFMFEFFSRISDTTSLHCLPPPSSSVVTTAKPVDRQPNSAREEQQIFIRSFVFQPALPIKIDYTTKWRFPTDTMGTLPGILISLYHLDNSELTLKSLNCKKGFLGLDSLLECVTQEWSTDIMTRQLPLILKGVGPTHYITQFVHGVVDLVRLPYYQYQEDGRLVWGLQQGASSFSTSTGLAVVELTSRTLETLQSVAQMVYDLVTPVPVEGHGAQGPSQRKAPHQPQDFREGVSNAYDVVATGLSGAAVDLYTVASQEHEERGMTGAVGGILRQIPGTVVKPVILLSEATRHVLGGVKNQLVPDARREAREKWKTAETND